MKRLVLIALPLLILLGGCSSQDFGRPVGQFGDLVDSGDPYVAKTDEEEARARAERLATVLGHWEKQKEKHGGDYLIGPDDVIVVNIMSLEMPGEVTSLPRTVSRSGTAVFPLVGPLEVGGLTPREIEERVAAAYDGRYLRNPQVTVSVREYRSVPVVVSGAVMRPGVYFLRQNESTVLEMLSAAGGLAVAAGDSLLIVRRAEGAASNMLDSVTVTTNMTTAGESVEEGVAPPAEESVDTVATATNAALALADVYEPVDSTPSNTAAADVPAADVVVTVGDISGADTIPVDLQRLLVDGDIRMNLVVKGGDIEKEAYVDCDKGIMVNSGILDGLEVTQAIKRIIDWLEQEGRGKHKMNYKLRDWVFSRQRYWGEPIPLVNCGKCGWVAIPEDQLPLELPEIEDFSPPEDGQSPLNNALDWVNTTCPQCGEPCMRETDTMPQWAGSCWYFLRYLDPDNDKTFAAKELLDYWMPIDWYNGGMEHTTLHLLYSRFWYKFLYDQKHVPTAEPYARRTSHGMILGEDNEKMSKSRGNVVNPDDVVDKYGSDTFRIFEMYLGAFDQASAWSNEGVVGMHRFLKRVWSFQEKVKADAKMNESEQRLVHCTIKAVGQRIERMKFNTAVAAMMSYSNELAKKKEVPLEMMKVFCLLLAPFAPHICEEMWERLTGKPTLSKQGWPEFDPELAKDKLVTIPIQVNGKLRDSIEVEEGTTKEDIIEMALGQAKIKTWLDGKAPKRTVYVPGKLVNVVV